MLQKINSANSLPTWTLDAQPYRVLVVDADDAHHRLVQRVLEAPEFIVTGVVDGERALTELERTKYDVVLLDHALPGINGLDLCRIVRANARQRLLPILILTGMARQRDAIDCLHAGADDVISKPFWPPELLARVRGAAARKRLVDDLDDAEAILVSLARLVEARDSETGDHCGRLVGLGRHFADVLGLDAPARKVLRSAAFLHDLGKVAIPDAILLKAGPLTEAEKQVMRKHPTIGAELCAPLSSLEDVVGVILNHHECWDGSGYPAGRAGTEIPYLARVFQIIDVFDALSSRRPYKRALPFAEVLPIMASETLGGKWDPQLMPIFVEMLSRHPEYAEDIDTVDRVEDCLRALRGSGALDGTRFAGRGQP